MNTSATGGLLTAAANVVETDAIVDAIQETIAGVTGIPGNLVRPRWQEPAPPMPPADVTWCAFGITEDEPEAADAFIKHDPVGGSQNIGQSTVARNVTLDVLCIFYGPGAQKAARILRNGLLITQNRDALTENAISLKNVGIIRAIPELINSQWVTRVDVSLQFVYTDSTAFDIQTITSGDVVLHSDAVTTSISISK